MSGVTCVRACKGGGLLAVALLVMTTASVWGFGDTKETRESLRGLTGMHVVVAKLPPDLERAGLAGSQLQTDAELRLRKAGIRVLTWEELLTTPGRSWLYISVLGFRTATTTGVHLAYVVFRTKVSLNQHVWFARDPAILEALSVANLSYSIQIQLRVPTAHVAETWSSDVFLGTVDPSNVKLIREGVADQVDEFINAYLAVNPLDRPPKASSTPKKPAFDERGIQQAQVLLKAAGFDPGPADGTPGERTRAALRQYQQAKGLLVTGELDQATQEALGMK